MCTPLSLQDRLERVWSLMCMPDNQRLDMAIKYSSDTYIDSLEEVRIKVVVCACTIHYF